MLDQTIWLSSKATSFTAVCAECAGEHGFFAAHVEGRLELERMHCSTTCARGHPIRIERGRIERGRIERANREPIGVLSA